MTIALSAVAVALFLLVIILCGLGWVAVRCVEVIWNELGPLLQHEMLMRRMEVRLMIDDAGYQIPDWINDDDDDDEGIKGKVNKGNKVVHLVPKPKQDKPE